MQSVRQRIPLSVKQPLVDLLGTVRWQMLPKVFPTERWQLRAVRRRFLSGGAPLYRGFGQPFNGQQLRLATVRRLLDVFTPDAIVETGTFLGDTTRFFAGNLVPVYSVEASRLFYVASRLSLAQTSGVRVIRGDSATVVDALVRAHRFQRPLAYLDAHWYGSLPLRDEVAALLRCESAVAVVDDCRVPGDAGYGFDDYGDARIDVELLAGLDLVVAYPAAPAESETGARRGTLYLGHGAGKDALARVADEGLITLA
jgi:hypothetical protein